MKQGSEELSRMYRTIYARRKKEQDKQEARIIGDYERREMDKVAKYKHRKRRK